jgi:hypothetical protein
VPSISGIELGADSCVVVRVRPHTAGAEVSALHLVERSQWPADDTAIVAALRGLRKSKRFPRRARVVAWGLSQPVTQGDPVLSAMMKPLTAAGFRVESALTPLEALAEIARTRPRGQGVAAVWLALNIHGAAIAVVRDGHLLLGRTFDWAYSADAVGFARGTAPALFARGASRASPPRHHACAERTWRHRRSGGHVRRSPRPAVADRTADRETDLEVETLDSTEGLHPTGKARSDRFAESAPALRLAVAAATAPIVAGRRPWAVRPLLRAAAAAAIVATVAWRGSIYWTEAPVRPVAERVAEARPPAPVATTGTGPANAPQARRAVSTPRALKPAAPLPAQATGVATLPPPVDMTPNPPAMTPEVVSAKRSSGEGGLSAPRVAQDPPAMESIPVRADTSRRKPVPLTEAVPFVESILVSQDRRIAIVGGRVVTVGDRVGPRVVAQIEQDAVVLQESSGHQIRVRIRE